MGTDQAEFRGLFYDFRRALKSVEVKRECIVQLSDVHRVASSGNETSSNSCHSLSKTVLFTLCSNSRTGAGNMRAVRVSYIHVTQDQPQTPLLLPQAMSMEIPLQ